MSKVYTTGEVAKICKVATRTVSNWVDEGVLKGFRLPASKDRRIPRESLVEFFETHNMPMQWLDPDP